MANKFGLDPQKPEEMERKLGQVWGVIFVVLVVILTGTIVWKSCLFQG